MKTQTWLIVLMLVIAISPLAYLWSIYDQLPAIIPTHYGLDGPDRFGPKSSAWTIALVMSGVSMFTFLLLWNLEKIDPKKAARLSTTVYRKFALLIVAFISALNFIIVHSAIDKTLSFERYLPVLIGCFFALLGNFMHSIKPNYFVGIRTPWTLENEWVWKKTHQLGGKLWFAGGILIAILGLILSKHAAVIVMIAGICIMALVPVVYSFIEFKKLQRSSS